MIQIKHSYTGNIIKSVNAISLVNANLQDANLQHADLQYVDLQYVDLQYADLLRADLQYANLQHADLQYANLQHADLQYAKLQGANLRGADLQGANLQCTDIRWVIGDGEKIISIQSRYDIVIAPKWDIMAIGCEQHTIDEWMNFSNAKINKMATGTLRWWKIWKPKIQRIIA